MSSPEHRETRSSDAGRGAGWLPNNAASVEDSQCAVSFGGQFAAVARRYGENVAVASEGSHITYRTLDSLSNKVARRLVSALGRANEPVAALIDRRESGPLALVSILKSGKIYVPLDITDPLPRLEKILADAGARLVLASRSHEELAGRLAQCSEILFIDGDGCDVADESVAMRVEPDSPATILYTSGSTGEPKGVVNSHRQLVHSSLVRGSVLGMLPGDAVSIFMSPAYAGGMKMQAGVLAHGASIIAADTGHLTNMAGFLRREGITIAALSPSLLRLLVDSVTDLGTLTSLRMLYAGGEPLRPADARLLRRALPDGVTFLNILGLSETGWVRRFAIRDADELDGDVVPVGYEVGDVEVAILDDSGRPLPAGHTGRIAVRGRYLATGYWKRPEATRAVFLDDADGSGRRTFITGDTGYVNADGCLVCGSRADLRLKVRNFGIDPSEVEAAVRRHPSVRDAVVLTREDKPDDERLVAYITCRSAAPSATQLRRFLSGVLPGHMVPNVFVFMKAFPLTGSGKVDRSRLPAPGHVRPELDTSFAEPRTPVESTLAAIFAEVLGIDNVGIDDDFFDLGGHSLSAARAIIRLNNALGVEMPLTELFARPTVARLAPEVARAMAETRSSESVARMLDEVENVRHTTIQSNRETQ